MKSNTRMENSNSDWHVIVTICINKHIAFWFYWYAPFHIFRCEMMTWGNHRLVCFEDFFWSFLFLSLARIKQCLPPSTEVSLTMVISFTILEQSRVIHCFVFAGQAGRLRCIVICITCNQPHIFVDSTLKSQALQFTCWAPFAINEQPSPLVRIAQNFFTAGFRSGKPRHCQKWKHFQLNFIHKRHDSIFFISVRN